MAFYDFYDTNPRDLDLGFYLFRGGIRPQGLSAELNAELNATLLAALEPIGAASRDYGGPADRARMLMADVLAHASGVLLLAHTKRIALFALNARELMLTHLRVLTAQYLR